MRAAIVLLAAFAILVALVLSEPRPPYGRGTKPKTPKPIPGML